MSPSISRHSTVIAAFSPCWKQNAEARPQNWGIEAGERGNSSGIAVNAPLAEESSPRLFRPICSLELDWNGVMVAARRANALPPTPKK